MKQLVFVIMILIVSKASAQLYKVSDCEKVKASALIIEGEVVDQQAEWNIEHTRIVTTNTIKITNTFKGNYQEDLIFIVTEGGTINDTTIAAADLLELTKNQKGVFFIRAASKNISLNTDRRLFEVYSGQQGVITYDIVTGKANTPFNSYNSIKGNLYPYLKRLTKSCYK